MCCLVVEIIMFLVGIIGISSGKVSLTRNRVTTGTPARIAGGILLLPLPVYILANVLAGISILGQQELAKGELPIFVGVVSIVAAALSVVCLLAAKILCVVTEQPVKHKRDLYPEDVEDDYDDRERPRRPPDDELRA